MTISFFKSKAKCISNRAQELRHRIDQLDTIICDNFTSPYIDGSIFYFPLYRWEYDRLKTELKSIYQEKGKQTMFRAKCRWIENGEHPIKFFSILKKLITTKKLSVNLDYKSIESAIFQVLLLTSLITSVKDHGVKLFQYR